MTVTTPLLLISGPVRYEAMLHSCETILVGGWVLTFYSAHSWRLYNAVSLEHQAAGTMTCYPTQSLYPNTEQTSPCPILIMPSAGLGSDTCDLRIPRSPRTGGGHFTHSATLTGSVRTGNKNHFYCCAGQGLRLPCW